MSNDKEFTTANPSSLDANGGEDLDGSGFEEEFTRYEPALESGER